MTVSLTLWFPRFCHPGFLIRLFLFRFRSSQLPELSRMSLRTHLDRYCMQRAMALVYTISITYTCSFFIGRPVTFSPTTGLATIHGYTSSTRHRENRPQANAATSSNHRKSQATFPPMNMIASSKHTKLFTRITPADISSRTSRLWLSTSWYNAGPFIFGLWISTSWWTPTRELRSWMIYDIRFWIFSIGRRKFRSQTSDNMDR